MNVKLNQEQLEVISALLDKKGLKQFDLRSEVVDHMASATEKYMEKELSFEKAFKLVYKDWLPELKSKNSWLLGLAWSGPKISNGQSGKADEESLLLFVIVYIAFCLVVFFDAQKFLY